MLIIIVAWIIRKVYKADPVKLILAFKKLGNLAKLPVFNPPNNAQSPLLRMFAKPLLSTPLSYMFFESSVSVAANFSGACNRSFKRIHSSSISCFLV